MVFNSIAFLIFWLVFTFAIKRSKKNNSRLLLLSISSLFFYGFWKSEYIFLIILSGLIDYICGEQIYRKPRFKKFFLGVSLFLNLSILFSFKYFGFFITVLKDINELTGLSLPTSFPSQSIFSLLPIGISFYTFQSLSYSIDIYRGEIKPARSFLKFFAYLSMFPQLVAGPIVRAKDIMNQLENLQLAYGDKLYSAFRLIVLGFFKKMVIADRVAHYVNVGFSDPLYPESSLYFWIVASLFSIQIYCDFSGYSDIARGLARMYGLEFSKNFNFPYLATSFKGFWGRWHISLSTWFRDYVYIPLGGNRKGRFFSSFNLWATMLISGVWHGANYTFLTWGAIHALMLSLEKTLNLQKVLPRPINRIITLFGVILAWVFFRADSISQALVISSKMLRFEGTGLTLPVDLAIILVGFIMFHIFHAQIFSSVRGSLLLQRIEPIALGIIAGACIFFRGQGDVFIYFQF